MRFSTALLLALIYFANRPADCQPTLAAGVPKNFTRSRFSLRNRPSTVVVPDVETTTGVTPSTVAVPTAADTFLVDDDAAATDAAMLPGQSGNPTASVACGRRTNDNHPWIAVLEHHDPAAEGGSRRRTLSKGVLINERFVLTTVSSVHNSHPFWTV